MNNNILYSRYPTRWHRNMWREGYVSGNGISGINVFGAIQNERILLNRGDIWYGLKKDAMPDVSDSLKIMRELKNKNEWEKANTVLADALTQSGYCPKCSVPLPLGELRLEKICGGLFSSYQRSLDMNSAEIQVKWKQGKDIFSRKYFVSSLRDIVAISVDSTVEDGYYLFLGLRNESDSQFPCPEDVRNHAAVCNESEWIVYSSQNDDGKKFGAVLYVKSDGQQKKFQDGIKITNSKHIEIFIKLFSNCDAVPESQFRAELEQCPNYEKLLQEQRLEFIKKYDNTELFLYDGESHSNEELLYECQKDNFSLELFEKLYRFGRYMFVCGTGNEGLPFALYGLWHGDYCAQWSQNVLNENLQLIYSHTLTGNLQNLLLPVFDYFDGMKEQYRMVAKNLFGCRGIVIPGYSCPNQGGMAVNVPVITNWTGAAAWIADFYYQYAIYSKNHQFAVERAIPFLREVCLFYSDFLYLDENGVIEIYPSVSPENSPKNFWKERGESLSHPMPTAVNATMDVALVKQVIGQYLELVAEYDAKDEAFCKLLQEMQKNLPAYRTEQGALKEWCFSEFEENENHRHFAHLYPLWPGNEIQSGDALFEPCRQAVMNRTRQGFHHQSGWSLTHLSNIYCRLHDSEQALQCLEYLMKADVLENFFTVHNDWRGMGVSLFTDDIAPVQLDANMGYISAIQEMLVHFNGKKLEIFPALPKQFKRGKVIGYRFDGWKISFEWDCESGNLNIETDCSDWEKYEISVPSEFKEVQVRKTK